MAVDELSLRANLGLNIQGERESTLWIVFLMGIDGGREVGSINNKVRVSRVPARNKPGWIAPLENVGQGNPTRLLGDADVSGQLTSVS